jgi:hypothetical protein
MVQVARDAPLPLSFGQESMWRYSQTPDGAAAYTLGLNDRVFGALDVAALRASLSSIVQRHEILRTTYVMGNGAPVAVIHPAEPVDLPIFDVSAEAKPHEAAKRIIQSEMLKVRDLANGPLVRFSLVRTGEDEHRLVRVCHHMLWDLWSTSVLLDELALHYNARVADKAAPLPSRAPLQFADYAAWQRQVMRPGTPAYENEVAWWKERMRKQARLPDLPFKRPDPMADADPADGVISWSFSPGLPQRLDRLRQREGTTSFVIWLAALAALLAAENRQPGVVIGAYAANRRRVEVQGMIGCFVNLVALGFNVDPATPFHKWLAEVRAEVMAAEAHCEVPHAELQAELQKSGIAPPEISVILGRASAHTRAEARFTGLTVARSEIQLPNVMPWGFSIRLLDGNELRVCRVTFDARIYDPAGVRRFMNRLSDLIDAVSRAPGRSIGELLAVQEVV